jgi:hypothetical protein
MKLFKSIVQFDAAKLQGGGGSGLGLWSKCQNKCSPILLTLILIA